jgi:hypothetical protein
MDPHHIPILSCQGRYFAVVFLTAGQQLVCTP